MLSVVVLTVAGAVALVVVALAVGLTIHGPSSHSAETNCGAAPASCGYPSASSTGVPSSITLRKVPSQVSQGTGWHYDPRGWVVVDGSGAVLDGLSIPYNVDVTASNVTIKDSKIVNGGADAFGISLRHTSNVIIQDSTISGTNSTTGRVSTAIKDIYGDSTGTTVLRDNISMFQTAVQMEAGLVQDNYLHNTGYRSGDHTNGVTSNGGTSLLTVNHNTILINRNQTDAIGLFQDFGTQANRTITNNLVAGGSYSVYGGAKTGGLPTANIVITGNRFATIYYPKSGSFGPAAYFDSGGTGNIWNGNVWDNNGATVPAP